jgi:leucyl-tRNA synthetase
VQELHVDVELVDDDMLNMEAFREWRPEYANAKFLTESYEHSGNRHEVYRCGTAVEKMSKSFFNVVNPDHVCDEYGADTLRLFEMFLGPLEQYKPWNTSGIEGVFRFLQKLWRWLHGADERTEEFALNNDPVPEASLRLLHQTIDKITRDIETLNFNTCVSQFMICVNDFSAAKVQNRDLVEKFVVLLSPFAPHLAEELWEKLGHKESITRAPWPKADPALLVADTMRIVVQVNGKVRGQFDCPASAAEADIFSQAAALEDVQRFTEGKEIKKRIYVPKKLVNFVAV